MILSHRIRKYKIFSLYEVHRIEDFKREKIIPHIVQEEASDGNFLKYLFAQDVLHETKIYSLLKDPVKSKNSEKDDVDDVKQ